MVVELYFLRISVLINSIIRKIIFKKKARISLKGYIKKFEVANKV